MSDVVISVENLSKRYRIGKKSAPYGSLRESIVDAATAPLQRIASLVKPRDPDSVSGPPSSVSQEFIWALKDISFEVKQGEVLGIIGRNGAGKSTLLKILSRITKPTEGRAVVRGRVGSLLEVGTGFHPELTGRENIYLNGAVLGMTRAEIERKFDEIVDFADIEHFLDTPTKRFSSGMYMRLAFAVAAHLETEVLLVDEVLAVGDIEFQKKCLWKMGEVAKKGRTVLFVSHNMVAVQNLCARGLILDNGKLSFMGSIDDSIRRYVSNMHLVANTNLLERSDRSGSQWLKFSKVIIYDSQGNEVQQAMCGQDIVIRFYYHSEIEKNFNLVLVAFNVRNNQGYLLTNLNSIDSGQTNFQIYHDGYFECHWPKLNLRSGIYECTIFCSVNGEIVDWIRSAFLIHVEDGDFYGTGKLIERQQGDFLVNHNWSYGKVPLHLANSIMPSIRSRGSE
jgi:lipopolysaccharide transport system ATP-binding protein